MQGFLLKKYYPTSSSELMGTGRFEIPEKNGHKNAKPRVEII
jgi:hypothetical protein